MTIETNRSVADWEDGESVAVDGVCLTVARRVGRAFEADVVAETLKCTTLSGLHAGDPVHLERSLALGDRLGGHFVQGHVDAVAAVAPRRFEVALIPETLARTKLGDFRPGDRINVEADLIARYLESLMRGKRR